MEQSSEQLLRVSMELGGNAPFIVFEDADLDAAVEGALIAKMRNIGEACTAANRFYVADALYDSFIEALGERMESLKVGRGTEEGVEVGPLIDDEQRGEGPRAGRRRRRQGCAGWWAAAGRPTARATSTRRPCWRHPRRGAAAEGGDLRTGRTGQALLRRGGGDAVGNDTEYGLVAYLYTRDLGRAIRVMEELEYGMVGLNQGIVSNPAAPFGGIKHSVSAVRAATRASRSTSRRSTAPSRY